MAEHAKGSQAQASGGGGARTSHPHVNWAAVLMAATVLLLVVALVGDPIWRVGLSLVLFLLAFRFALPGVAEPTEIENPILEKMREQSTAGLDRRKYGRLRAYTERLLVHVRSMNRLAIDARQGKLTQRHANAELDRLMEMMRGALGDIRNAACVPTPEVNPGALDRSRPQPQVIMPSKKKRRAEYGAEVEKQSEAAKTTAKPTPSEADPDEKMAAAAVVDADKPDLAEELRELEEAAEAAAASRTARATHEDEEAGDELAAAAVTSFTEEVEEEEEVEEVEEPEAEAEISEAQDDEEEEEEEEEEEAIEAEEVEEEIEASEDEDETADDVEGEEELAAEAESDEGEEVEEEVKAEREDEKANEEENDEEDDEGTIEDSAEEEEEEAKKS